MFFDNLQVTHVRGPLLEETHYYPFGLTMAGISSKAAGKLENRFKYNGIELNEDLGLNTYDAFFRNLDPQIGRWWQIDPKVEEDQESMSPYNSMANDPVKLSDRLGDVPDILIVGENNSGVWIKTDLINIAVDVRPLGIDFGGKYTLEGDHIVSAALDLVGIVDPTGAADAANATLQAKKGDILGAITSGIGMIPYLGDLAKANRIKKDVKVIKEGIDGLTKAEQRAAKLSKVKREGQDFTKAGKEAVIDLNKAKNNGKTICSNCKEETIPAKKNVKGVKIPKNRTEVDHVKRKRENGSGTPDNGQVLCNGCNNKKG